MGAGELESCLKGVPFHPHASKNFSIWKKANIREDDLACTVCGTQLFSGAHRMKIDKRKVDKRLISLRQRGYRPLL